MPSPHETVFCFYFEEVFIYQKMYLAKILETILNYSHCIDPKSIRYPTVNIGLSLLAIHIINQLIIGDTEYGLLQT
jgi:hypothetical protein